MTKKVSGNIAGLGVRDLRRAELIFRRRVRPDQIVSSELASVLCAFSRETGRQIGVMIGRRGHLEHVVVGDADRIWLPDVGRLRTGRGRLRGLRLVHTHLKGEPISNDDLTDLALLRLDMIAALILDEEPRPHKIQVAHLLSGERSEPWRIGKIELLHDSKVDPLALVLSLEEEFARQSEAQLAEGRDRAVLVHIAPRRSAASVEEHLAELKELCRTAGVVVVDTIVQNRDRPDPRYAVGKGKLEAVLLRATQLGADLLIFDPELTPAQTRALSDLTELRVIDRSLLILDIFAQRATSSEGKLQVELAQLRSMLPRLVARNSAFSRLTGGIGGRGPGETKLEINRRRARQRIARLERQLLGVRQQRARRRALRSRRNLPVATVVGYTNAGKSTLMNTLTHGKIAAENRLFATLNPTSRRLRFPREREIIINDSLGFILDLPKELVEAFRATLEEIGESDLLIHVVDVSSPRFQVQIDSVQRTLGDLGFGDRETILVFNKIDLIDERLLRERNRSYDAIALSALDERSTLHLLDEIERFFCLGGSRIPPWPSDKAVDLGHGQPLRSSVRGDLCS